MDGAGLQYTMVIGDQNTMDSGVKIPWVGVDIPCVGVDISWVEDQNPIGRGFKISWVGRSIFYGKGSKYDGLGFRYSMDMGFNIHG